MDSNETIETKKELMPDVKEKLEHIIEDIAKNGLQVSDIDLLYKIIDIHKDICNEEYWKVKEDFMMYRDDDYRMDDSYGRMMRDSRGRYMDNYSRRGVPGSGRGRYRGYDYIDEVYENYGNYSEGKEMYGNDHETEKSFDKMLQSLEDFTYLIMQEADSQDKIEKVRKTARKISEF